MSEEQVPVLIVGGGGAGLTASMLLARQGVDHLLISARPGTSDLPKAHVLNQRAMEILEDCDVAEEIEARSTPAEQMAATAYYAGFAGDAPIRGAGSPGSRSWGAGGQNELWRAASPWRQLNLPQIRLEPILKAGAERRSPGRIRFNHELLELAQDEDGVTALVRDNGSGDTYTVRSQYLIGADGGRRVAGLIGVEYEGLGRRDEDRDPARERRLLGLGGRSRRPHPLDFLPRQRDDGGDGADGAGDVGAQLGGVGDSSELPG